MIKKILFFILSLTLASSAWAASKESAVKKGNALYKKGEYEASLKNYEDALKADDQSPAINFNLGTALYKNKKYSEAIPYLQKGLLSDQALLQKNAHFNLGDAFFEQGNVFGEKHIDQAIAALEESLRQFTAVVNVDDKDTDARYNRDIVQKQLERLKAKKQQQQEQQKQQGQNKDQKQDEQKQNQGQSQDKKSAESSQPENKDAQDKKQEQKPEQGFSQNQDKKQESPEENKQASAKPMPGEMTKEEAKALLKQFEQSPESTGLLNFDKHKTEEPSVLKDW